MRLNYLRKRKAVIPLFIGVGAIAVGLIIYAAVGGLFSPTKPEGAARQAPAADRPSIDESIPVGTSVGNRAPDFTLRALNGGPVTLSSFLGKVVILDFWASWCYPCRISMPALHALWERYRDQGVVLLGVSLDRSESNAEGYLKANGYTDVTALWESPYASQAVAKRYGVSGIPHTFVIDRNGIIRFSGHPTQLTASLIESLL
ncbi:hypothetical protein DRJ24_03875 [Candidatus Acetothermia bacterium]|nr:MAG: hypothetical protein DRJ24_03875 [Candidatus Acetothermia bacterium]